MPRLKDLKPSELIRRALYDLESVEQDPRYSVFMYEVHSPSVDSCEVDLAGAVMAKSMEVPPDQNMDISQMKDPDNRAALCTIRYFQSGRIQEGLKQIDAGTVWPAIKVPFQEEDMAGWRAPLNRMMIRSRAEEQEAFVPAYEDGRERFRDVMVRMADEMEAQGI